MVLKQKMSAMSEHNTQNGGQPDLQQAHLKKMSLATKLKKQRRTRQSGTDSPVPFEGAPQGGSKSPVRDSDSYQTGGYPTNSTDAANNGISTAHSSSSSNSAAAASNSNSDTPAPDSNDAASKSSSSMGTSLLHNKRRAMHLAKTRRSQDSHQKHSYQKESAVTSSRLPIKPTVKVSAPESATQTKNEAQNKMSESSSAGNWTDSSYPYSHHRAAERVSTTEPKFSNRKVSEPAKDTKNESQSTMSNSCIAGNGADYSGHYNSDLPAGQDATEPDFSSRKISESTKETKNEAQSKMSSSSSSSSVGNGTDASYAYTSNMVPERVSTTEPDFSSRKISESTMETKNEAQGMSSSSSVASYFYTSNMVPERVSTTEPDFSSRKISESTMETKNEAQGMSSSSSVGNGADASCTHSPEKISESTKETTNEAQSKMSNSSNVGNGTDSSYTYGRHMAVGRVSTTEPNFASRRTSSFKPKPKPVPDYDVTPVESAESGESQPFSVTSNKSNRGESVMAHQEHEEVVPWETEVPEPSASKISSKQSERESDADSDRFSQVSAGRSSVISNGVVAYDESIMSLAKLDNYRSKANQTRANIKETMVYPGTSGRSSVRQDKPPPPEPSTCSVSEVSEETFPVSAAKAAASQAWKGENRVTPGRSPSWRKVKSPAPVSNNYSQEKPTVTSSSKVRGKFSSQPPPWMKSPATCTGVAQDEAPPSPTPSNTSYTNSQPVSPARSAYSAASYRLDRPSSPFLMMPKFSSSRSDVGVEPVTSLSAGRRETAQSGMPKFSSSRSDVGVEPVTLLSAGRRDSTQSGMPKFSSSRSDVGAEPVTLVGRRESTQSGKSWKASPIVKKTTFALTSLAPARQERAGSPTPSWHSTRSDHDQESCPASPNPSQASEAEPVTENSVSKAKTWSTKKQSPAWMKRAPSPSVIQSQAQSETSQVPASPRHPAKTAASPATKARQYAQSPSIPKPSTTSRQIFATEGAEHERPSPSNRRHSSPAPSWVKPKSSEKSSEKTDAKAETPPPPVPTTKTWSVNKKTPAWMKKVPGTEEPPEEPPVSDPTPEKPPVPVPTTKIWPAKKQTPSWLKQPAETEDEVAVASAPSPRRNSAPAWTKPGQPGSSEQKEKTLVSPQPITEKEITPTSPKPAGRNHHQQQQPGTTIDAETMPSPGKAWRARPSNNVEQKQLGSPRSQSWKPRSPPLNVVKSLPPNVIKSPPPSVVKSPPPIGVQSQRKGRHSIGGDFPKVSPALAPAPAPVFVKKQRCPSPSVAQLQEQIFVTKLGVAGESHKISETQRVPHPQKGPTSPSPQVKQLQQIIFSPEKAKAQTKAQTQIDEQEDRGTSPAAAGWWKRVPDPPEIRTEHYEAPTWRHEGSTDEQQSEHDVSPSPTMTSEPLPQKKTWSMPHPGSAINDGAPSWLKDVAAFHSSSSPKLPSQPPVWQPPLKISSSSEVDSESTIVPRSSPKNNSKQVDESSSELMVMSSTSTTSKEDLAVQQEDTKSLIQMAADSVLIADYEQAMQRVVVESKSDEEDESVGNSASNTLPNELPVEFQKALTMEENEEEATQGDTKEPSVNADLEKQHDSVQEYDAEEKTQQDASIQTQSSHDKEDEKPERLPGPIASSTCSRSADHSQNGSPNRQVSQPSEDRTKGVVFGDPSTFGDAGGHVSEDVAPNVADRAKAIIGWAAGRAAVRVAPPHEEKIHHYEAEEYIRDDEVEVYIRDDEVEEVIQEANCSDEAEEVIRHDEVQEIRHDETEEVLHTDPNETSMSFCNSDPNFSGMVQDENGFPCAPLPEEDIAAAFGDSNFHADAFGSEQWIEQHDEDEKKDADTSDMLQYWSPDVEALNDSSEWGNRDPGLDSVAINSPEPVSTANIMATAEKVLQKWSHLTDSPLAEDSASVHFDTVGVAAEEDGWVEKSQSSRSKENMPSSALACDDMWDLQHLAELKPGNDGFPTQDRRQPSPKHPAAQDAAWASPPRHNFGLREEQNPAIDGFLQTHDRHLSPKHPPAHDAAWTSPPRHNFGRREEHQPANDSFQTHDRQQSPKQLTIQDSAWASPPRQNFARSEEPIVADPMWGSSVQAIDATWGVPHSDPFSGSAGQFDMVSPEEHRPRGDAFDPFGEDEDAFATFSAGKLFSEPPEAFVAIDSFSPPPAMAPKYNSRNEHYESSRRTDVFDTYYHAHETYYPNQTIPVRSVSQDGNGVEF